ncbi:PREDICTED: mitochondrial import receptor subunit TOM70-like [Amphimedon queenslandica]|uniref:Mitochondrial import receptor subunit TOM70 n=1 Tax=Amphimedon queenslandica TaxID=400682 RepID=A0A1X7UV41_AMPQE|nr:PREDICTED: mitochondrial import receptor subunit TOM70-like [Amphimedon queenslandica]|eukprot:XP_019852329.1 PREDICTED: mitochondrial import receptor subunit TOM70-like [Amphimedon queenslandica]
MSSSTGSSGGEGGGLARWQVVVAAVGVSVAVAGTVGAVYWLCSKGGSKKGSKPEADSRVNSLTSETGSTGHNEDREPSALERAREAKSRGNALFKQKQLEEALKCYKEAIEICPPEETDDIATFHHNIAAVYDKMVVDCTDNDEKVILWEGIRGHCTEAIKLKPKYIKAIFRRFHANRALNNKREALLDVTRLMILDEDSMKTLAELAQSLFKDVSKELAEENFPKLGALEPPTQLVRTYFNSFLWKDDISRSRLKELWDGAGGDVDRFDDEAFVKAAGQFLSGQYSGIIDVLTQAVNEGHEVFKSRSLLLRGTLLSLWRRETDAMNDLRSVLSLPDVPSELLADAHIKIAAIYAGLSQVKECYEEFDKALNEKPDHVDVFMQRARVAMESDDPSVVLKGVDDLEIVLKLSPTSSIALYCMGSMYHRAGLLSRSIHFFEGARSKFEQAYKSAPGLAEGLLLYALFLQDVEEVQLSEEILHKAIELEPDNASAHFTISILYLLAHRDMDKAINSLRTAIEMDSSCIQAYETLASLEMQKGNKEKALELYDAAVKNSRSILEMQQGYLAREVFTTQNEVCDEYGIDPVELLTSRMASFSTGAANN